MDVEFARMRERLETMNLILDDIQVCMIIMKIKYIYLFYVIHTDM